MNILSFGEILWDVYPDSKFLGGAPLNFAAHIKKHGAESFMVSAVGRDELGREAIDVIESWGINSRYIGTLNKPTGRCIVTLDKNKVPSYNLLEDMSYDYITCEEITDCFDVLYFGTLALRSENNFRQINKLINNNNFSDIFVDINIRSPFYSQQTVQFSVEKATVLKISVEELPVIAEILKFKSTEYKKFALELSKVYSNLKCIIITLGSAGAYALDCITGAKYSCDAEKVQVKSTVGAGDSFSAAFLYKYINKYDIMTCLKHASIIAGYVVSHYDAVPEYEIEDFD